MPFLIFAMTVITGAIIWYYRAQNARIAAKGVASAATDVRLAARRFRFKQKTNAHPVDCIDDPRLAAAGVVHAIASMSNTVTAEQTTLMERQFQSVFDVDSKEASEIAVFGAWIADQCGTRAEAVRRLAKRLEKLAGADARPDLDRMVSAVLADNDSGGNDDELEALNTIKRAFGG